jgi:UDP-N-acetylmuramoylalanine--D-glutamate ligase
MTPVVSFADRHVALFGLGGSGLATARALLAGGARVAAWDDNEAAREKARAAGVSIVDLSAADWSTFGALILAPGVPLTHPAPHWTVVKAHAAGIEVIGDIELFCRERARLAPDAPFIAITGTNGKSTTTALIAHVLREAGRDVQLGGNIGIPVLALEPPTPNRVHVIECSAFKIDLAPSINPSVGVLLNLSPDHLDRHGDMETYAAVKERLVAGADFAVVGVDDEYCATIYRGLRERDAAAVAISNTPTDVSEIVHYDNGRLRRDIALNPGWSLVETLVDLRKARALRGAHNGQNAAAAFAACEWLDIAHDEIGAGMKSFPGLAHRMEEVARLDRVVFVNDSKATNADAAEKALLSYEDIFWIIGGKSKEGGIEPLRPLFGRIRKAYLIGAASEDFARTLGGDVAHESCGALDVAIERAARDAMASPAREPVVLLSPACASYDQFPNFEVRGDRFRDLSRALVARMTSPGR